MITLVRRLLNWQKLSVVVVVYDMGREAPRTLQSLSSAYQRGVSADDYEVIVVDNGSPVPLGEAVVSKFGTNFHYRHIRDASPSPAAAVNVGVRVSRGEYVSILIDGARMVTPGLICSTLRAFRIYDTPIVTTLGWHLGHEPQQKSINKGYTKDAEDALLAKINWPADGYRLFEIACLGGSSKDGCFRPISECNTIALHRKAFLELGGYDERFDTPGGGLVNLDFFRRACELPGSKVVQLLGEGSFHQLHGGTATNIPESELAVRFQKWAEQYRQIRGQPWEMPRNKTELLGTIPTSALEHIAWSANRAIEMDEIPSR